MAKKKRTEDLLDDASGKDAGLEADSAAEEGEEDLYGEDSEKMDEEEEENY